MDIAEFHVGNDCGLFDCDVVAPVNDFYVGANRFTLQNVHCVAGTWRTWIQAGADHFIENVRGNLLLDYQSTGTIVGPVYGTVFGYYTNVQWAVPASWTRMTRQGLRFSLPTSVDSVVVIGKLTGGRSAIWARLSVAVVGSGISVARQYSIGRGWAETTSDWYRCWPMIDGQQANNTDDFYLELREDEDNCWLRVRRAAGTTAAELAVYIETNAIFELGGEPPSGTPVGNHQSTAATQKRGLLYTTSPVITRTSAPDDSDLAVGQCAIWFDGSSTPKLMIKARKSGDGYVSGSVALS